MKILLVMSPMFSHKTHCLANTDTEIPIGLCYLAGMLEKHGYSVTILDGQVVSDIDKKLEELLKNNNFQAIGFSSTSPAISNTKRLTALAKRIKPKTPVFLGGAHPTVLGPKILEELTDVDVAVLGEGENTILELMEYVKGRMRLDNISGIAFRKQGKIITTKPREFIADLDIIPFPAFHLVDILKYTPPPGLFFKKPTVGVASARGCPYSCNYCADSLLWHRKCRMHSANYVADMMELLAKKYGVKEIRFFDDTFTINRERVVDICNKLLEKNLNLLWRCALRADRVDYELLKLMKKAGLCSISYGIESGSEEILKKMNRQITIDQIRQAVKWSKSLGIETKGFFMLNYPGDTIKTTEETIALSRELDLDFVGFNLTVPFLGTQVREEVLKNCQIEPKYWDNWDKPIGNQIYFYQKDLPPEYLKKAYLKAIRGFHLRPKMILRSFMKIKSRDILKSYFKGFLRMFRIKVLD